VSKRNFDRQSVVLALLTSVMTMFETLARAQDTLNSLFVQGLNIVSPEEFDVVAQMLSALQLTQPAALIGQIRQDVANHAVTSKDADLLVKILQLLAQATVQLSTAGSVNLDQLAPAHLAVHAPPEEIPAPAALRDLDAILRLPNPFVRARCVTEYMRTASADELVVSLESLWCDDLLSFAIGSGLQSRPEEAFRLAQQAWEFSNIVIRRTALRVLETLGQDPAHTPRALKLIATFRDTAAPPLTYLLEEANARMTGDVASYADVKQRRFKAQETRLNYLQSRHKNERLFSIRELAKTHDPCFTGALLQVLQTETEPKNLKAVLATLVEIGGFEAIPHIAALLDGPLTPQALDTLSRFGDRSAMTYILKQLESRASSQFERDILKRYGELVAPPLAAVIAALDKPKTFKKGLNSLLTIPGFDRVMQRLRARTEYDERFAAKFNALMQSIFPKTAHVTQSPSATAAPPPTKKSPTAPSPITVETLNTGNVRQIIPTPDGQALILQVAHLPGDVIKIFKPTTWQQEATVNVAGHLRLTALSPDGQTLLTFKIARQQQTNVYTVDIWEFGKWEQCVASIPTAGEVYSLTITPDRKYVLIGGDHVVQVVTFGDWQAVRELSEPASTPNNPRRVCYLAALPGTSTLLVGDWRGWLQVWNTTTWEKITEVKADSWWPGRVALSADGKYLIYGGFIGIKVWDTQTWQEVRSVKKPSLTSMTITPDNKYLIAGKDKKLKIFDFTTLKNLLTFDADSPLSIVKALPDGKHIVTNGKNGIKVWELDWAAF